MQNAPVRLTKCSLCAVLIAALAAAFVPVYAEDTDELRDPADMIDCDMTFELDGWSAFYKTAKGKGVILCDNGQRAAVDIKVKGGGFSFGKTRILQGTGKFSDVFNISETFGSYASLQASAAAVKASEAMAMTKGKVSLALKGTGQGWDLGLSMTRFKIKARSIDEAR